MYPWRRVAAKAAAATWRLGRDRRRYAATGKTLQSVLDDAARSEVGALVKIADGDHQGDADARGCRGGALELVAATDDGATRRRACAVRRLRVVAGSVKCVGLACARGGVVLAGASATFERCSLEGETALRCEGAATLIDCLVAGADDGVVCRREGAATLRGCDVAAARDGVAGDVDVGDDCRVVCGRGE